MNLQILNHKLVRHRLSDKKYWLPIISFMINKDMIVLNNPLSLLCPGPIKNELYYTDINTGRYQLLRSAHKDRDDVPIVGIKVSYLHQVNHIFQSEDDV